jgi:hypothetical protein
MGDMVWRLIKTPFLKKEWGFLSQLPERSVGGKETVPDFVVSTQSNDLQTEQSGVIESGLYSVFSTEIGEQDEC